MEENRKKISDEQLKYNREEAQRKLDTGDIEGLRHDGWSTRKFKYYPWIFLLGLAVFTIRCVL